MIDCMRELDRVQYNYVVEEKSDDGGIRIVFFRGNECGRRCIIRIVWDTPNGSVWRDDWLGSIILGPPPFSRDVFTPRIL